MSKLNFTKAEIQDIKSKIYLNDLEEKVLDMWLVDKSIVETSMKLNISTHTVSKYRDNVKKKIKRVI